jgi:hypothetical protein
MNSVCSIYIYVVYIYMYIVFTHIEYVHSQLMMFEQSMNHSKSLMSVLLPCEDLSILLTLVYKSRNGLCCHIYKLCYHYLPMQTFDCSN